MDGRATSGKLERVPTADDGWRRRRALERRWLTLTRHTLPGLAAAQSWPIRHDHCFQRVLLDHACGGVWYDHIAGRPAYRAAPDRILQAGLMLGLDVAAGEVELAHLDAVSRRWRRARRR